jgi:hypothetical protein
MAEFDFDAWLALALRDEAAFNAARRALLQRAIAETPDPALFMNFQSALDMMRIGAVDQAQTLRQMNRMSDELVNALSLLSGQLEEQVHELLRNLKQRS